MPGSMNVAAYISSPTPSEISAKIVPDLLVVIAPKNKPPSSPPPAPARGTSATGSGRPWLIARMTWMAAYPPRPKYTACPNDRRPVCPKSRLNDSANTAAMAICVSSDRPKSESTPGR